MPSPNDPNEPQPKLSNFQGFVRSVQAVVRGAVFNRPVPQHYVFQDMERARIDAATAAAQDPLSYNPVMRQVNAQLDLSGVPISGAAASGLISNGARATTGATHKELFHNEAMTFLHEIVDSRSNTNKGSAAAGFMMHTIGNMFATYQEESNRENGIYPTSFSGRQK
jgi:hypothetical protein